MNALTRRDFLGGLAASGALSGCSGLTYATKGGSWRAPNLRFGVLSDLHVRVPPNRGGRAEGFWTGSLVRALQWFDFRQVDAVVIAGDLTDGGSPAEWQAVADAWESVFPGGCSRDGRPVERLFICGNRDGASTKDAKREWERVFREEYAPISLKMVRGYPFVLAHWAPGAVGVPELLPFYAENGHLLGSDRPFFHVQHPHPMGTCHGLRTFGCDNGETARILSGFSNAVAISGHSHYSVTDERAIWQEEFTSVAAGPLRRVAVRADAHAPLGYENSRAQNSSHDIFDPMKLLPELDTSTCEQGLLVSVHDEGLEIARQEFSSGLPLGPAWKVPLPARPAGPLSASVREDAIPVPEFAPEAVIRVRPVLAVNRQGQKERAFEISVPPANAVSTARCHEMEFVAETDDYVRKSKFVLMPGFHLPPEHPVASRDIVCRFAIRDLPLGRSRLRLSVFPRDCFGRSGTPLTANFG